MLDVIGAGSNTRIGAEIDWHKLWKNSEEKQQLDREIVQILESKQQISNRDNATSEPREFATNWFTQITMLLRRDFECHWRDPIYLMNKLMLNLIGGLFMGFTFFQAKDTLQGTQNKVFVSDEPFEKLSFEANILR